eukprot:6015051-Pleurochrysis_carterae.AAC.2
MLPGSAAGITHAAMICFQLTGPTCPTIKGTKKLEAVDQLLQLMKWRLCKCLVPTEARQPGVASGVPGSAAEEDRSLSSRSLQAPQATASASPSRVFAPEAGTEDSAEATAPHPLHAECCRESQPGKA